MLPHAESLTPLQEQNDHLVEHPTVRKEPHRHRIESWEPQTTQELAGVELLQRMQAYIETALPDTPQQTYFVGGFTRDLLFHELHGRPFAPKDVDIATSLTPEQVNRFCQANGVRNITQERIDAARAKAEAAGEAYDPQSDTERRTLTSRLLVPYGDTQVEVEVVTFRREAGYAGHAPGDVEPTDDPLDDVVRRDFTVNAMYFDPLTKEVVDYVGGYEDVRNTLLRTVGDPKERLVDEDRVRMLRYVRFLTKYGMQLDRDVAQVIRGHAEELGASYVRPAVANDKPISRERVRDEFLKMLVLDNPYKAVSTLGRLGLLRSIFPDPTTQEYGLFEREHAVYTPENIQFVGSDWRHTLESLRAIDPETTDVSMRLAILLEGYCTPEEVRRLLHGLTFPVKEQKDVAYLIENMAIVRDMLDGREIPPRVRQELFLDEGFQRIFDASVCRKLGRTPERDMEALSALVQTIRTEQEGYLKQYDAVKPPKAMVTPQAMMQQFRVKGAVLGQLLRVQEALVARLLGEGFSVDAFGGIVVEALGGLADTQEVQTAVANKVPVPVEALVALCDQQLLQYGGIAYSHTEVY